MIRVCPKRDAKCPHGMDCPYAIDRYSCRDELGTPADLQRIATELAQVSVLDRAERIGRALMEERERCARICDDTAAAYEEQEQHGWQKQRSDELRYIATYIRKGNPR
jgi:hypothetical protein